MMSDFEKKIKEYEDKVSFLDVRFGKINTQAITTENKELKICTSSVNKAYNVRMMINGAWGFAASNDYNKINETFLKAYKLAKNASGIKKEGTEMKELKTYKDKIKSSAKNAFNIPLSEKIKILYNIYENYDYDNIKTVQNSLKIYHEKNNYMNNCGTRIIQESDRIRIGSFINGMKNNNLQSTYFIKCARMGWDFLKKINLVKEVRNTQEQLKRMLNAGAPKPGKHDIISDNKMSGTFFHEALGHALEADHLYAGASCIKRIGQVIGPEFLTISDNPTLKNYWGSYEYDDEGVKAEKNILVKDGVVVNFMNDIPSYFDISNLEKTSNGRAMDMINYPIPRMSNTVVEQGDYSKEELFEELKNGLYVTGFEGGAVDINTGTFSFKTREAFKIKNGKIVENYRDLNLSGNILKTVKNIKKIGKSPENNYSGGMCGKSSQYVPVSDNVPEIIIGDVLAGN